MLALNTNQSINLLKTQIQMSERGSILCSMTGQEKGDLFIQVAAWVGLTVFLDAPATRHHRSILLILYIHPMTIMMMMGLTLDPFSKVSHDIAEILLMLALNTNQSINLLKTQIQMSEFKYIFVLKF
jgi:hypothetical protein